MSEVGQFRRANSASLIKRALPSPRLEVNEVRGRESDALYRGLERQHRPYLPQTYLSRPTCYASSIVRTSCGVLFGTSEQSRLVGLDVAVMREM